MKILVPNGEYAWEDEGTDAWRGRLQTVSILPPVHEAAHPGFRA